MHGAIEGRAMGREKGYEIWEELGFYEGFAQTWKAVYAIENREHECVCGRSSPLSHADRKNTVVRCITSTISSLSSPTSRPPTHPQMST